MKSPTIDFSRIREHHGSQNTGFEELVYQLIPSIAGVGLSEVVRHGTPDGGIEASIESDDGSVWGWQAKYFLSIGDSQLAQMKRSFESALQSNPTLARYTFVLPCNPPRGKAEARQERKRETQRRVRPLGFCGRPSGSQRRDRVG